MPESLRDLVRVRVRVRFRVRVREPARPRRRRRGRLPLREARSCSCCCCCCCSSSCSGCCCCSCCCEAGGQLGLLHVQHRVERVPRGDVQHLVRIRVRVRDRIRHPAVRGYLCLQRRGSQRAYSGPTAGLQRAYSGPTTAGVTLAPPPASRRDQSGRARSGASGCCARLSSA